MATREEYYNKLCDLISKVSGSVKLKTSNVFLNCLRGKLNSVTGKPEVSVCMEDLKAHIEEGGYAWVDKKGKTWVPIHLQVWAGTAKDEATTPMKEEAASAPMDPDEIPY